MENGVQFDYSKLKGRIAEIFKNQTAFVAKINMSVPTFIKKMNGEGYFNQREISEILSVLSLTTQDVPSYFFNIKS